MSPAGADLDRLLDLVAVPAGLANLFDPYRERRDGIDRADAPSVRCRNLRRYLDAVAAAPVAEVWMAEAPGSLGGACSGVPLVPEACFNRFAALTGVELERATTGPVPTTRTAEAVWAHIERLGSVPLLWNTVLHHPHLPGKPLTNRTPNRAEINAFASIRATVLELVPRARIIALGRVAHRALGPTATYVRHPAQGGRTLFDRQMAGEVG